MALLVLPLMHVYGDAQESDENVAQSLGLLGTGDAREEGLFLLQLPALLPAMAPPPAPPDSARPAQRDDAQPPPGALSLRDLPSGKVREPHQTWTLGIHPLLLQLVPGHCMR